MQSFQRILLSSHPLQALKEQAKLFKDAKVPIYGVGIQSHIYNAHLDITQLKVSITL